MDVLVSAKDENAVRKVFQKLNKDRKSLDIGRIREDYAIKNASIKFKEVEW
jgi:hypothetical protein